MFSFLKDKGGRIRFSGKSEDDGGEGKTFFFYLNCRMVFMPFYDIFCEEGGLMVIFKLLVLCDIILMEEKDILRFHLLIVHSL